MTMKPLAGLALVGLLAALLAPAPASATVQRTVLVEETGWHT
jgi:hypothetical protein